MKLLCKLYVTEDILLVKSLDFKSSLKVDSGRKYDKSEADMNFKANYNYVFCFSLQVVKAPLRATGL